MQVLEKLMRIELEDYTDGLIEKDGIFFSKSDAKISYPESGNETCFQIEDNSFWFNHRNNCIAKGVIKYSPDAIFFDIGGGNGFVAKGLEQRGISTVLVEPGIHGCINAMKRNLKRVICSTLGNASFKKNTIPAIGLFDVVEHIENDIDFLTTVHKFLKDNGLVFITVPAYKSLWSNEDVDGGHFRRYTLKELESKLRNVGFVISYSTYIFSILPLVVFVFRTIPSRLGLNQNSNSVEKHKKEHGNKSGFIGRVLTWIWKIELDKIGSGKKIPFGGSCFVIAKKVRLD